MRLPLAALALLLSLPAVAWAAEPRSSIFFYPWYSNVRHDGHYAHWTQGGHAPPFDLASHFFPARGAYSSGDPRVLRAQMRDIAAAGVDEVVSSWWGKGSPEDHRLPAVLRAAKARGLQVAVQLEPYPDRTVD
jgi:glycoprotein endo-alpha-1,2-mannosidase